MLETSYAVPGWGDRCYHQLSTDDLTVNCGRQLYPHDGRRFAYIGVATPGTQYAVRCAEPFAFGDDPDQARIGQVAVEVVEPLRKIRLVADGDDSPIRADLTFTARFVPVKAERHVIEVRGEVVTDYLNFFQSGIYDGTIEVAGEAHELKGHAGFRDRGWGLRKHESSGRRGFMIAVWCELPEAAVYLILYETASGRRVFTNGWLLDDSGVRAEARSIEHDIRLDGTLVAGGTLGVEWDDGSSQTVGFEARGRNFLAAIGYSLDEGLKRSGVETFDLTDPQVVARLDGQNDQGCTFDVDGVSGHGYVETGVGVHVRYRPDENGV